MLIDANHPSPARFLSKSSEISGNERLASPETLNMIRWHVDYRRGGEARWSLGEPRDARLRIPDDLLTCPVFLGGRDSQGMLHYRATAFLIDLPTTSSTIGAWCLVTARHNVLKTQELYGNTWVRMNVPANEAIDYEIHGNWIFPDDPGVDIAVVPFPYPEFQFSALPIPVRWSVTDQLVRDRQIGVGDDLIVVGLFSQHVGKSRNLPIVRNGSIASMPSEPLVDSASGEEFNAYLAEVRSVGGLSGSPVFVALNPVTRLLDDQIPGQAFYLLGLVRGHWEGAMERDFNETESGRLNTGIAMVTPATELLPLLGREEIVAHQKEIGRLLAEAKGAQILDWDDGEQETEFSRFRDMTKKLVSVPKKEIDEKAEELKDKPKPRNSGDR